MSSIWRTFSTVSKWSSSRCRVQLPMITLVKARRTEWNHPWNDGMLGGNPNILLILVVNARCSPPLKWSSFRSAEIVPFGIGGQRRRYLRGRCTETSEQLHLLTSRLVTEHWCESESPRSPLESHRAHYGPSIVGKGRSLSNPSGECSSRLQTTSSVIEYPVGESSERSDGMPSL